MISDRDNTFDTVLYLKRGDCAGEESFVGCDDDGDAGGTSLFSVPFLVPGEYYLFADGYSDAAQGVFTIEAQLGPAPEPPTNESCDEPQLVALGRDDEVSLQAPLYLAADDLPSGTCLVDPEPEGGVEVTYLLEIDEPLELMVFGDSVDGSGGDIELTLLGGACSGDLSTELGCAAGEEPVLGFPRLEVGSYWLVVTAATAAPTAYDIDILTGAPPEPPQNESCASAAVVPLDSDTAEVVEAFLYVAADDQADPTCAEAVAGDAVWELQVTEPLTLRVRSEAGPDDAPGLSLHLLQGACEGGGAAERFCATGDEPTLLAPRLEPGSYWLVADAMDRRGGAFELTLETLPPPEPPANESCLEAEPLAWGVDEDGAPHIAIEGNHLIALDDLAGTCGGDGGGDVVYQLSVAEPMSVRATIETSGWGDVVLHVRRDVCADGEEVACLVTDGGFIPQLDPGEYFIIVDSSGPGRGGGFALNLFGGPPVLPPDNDTCADAHPLEFDEQGRAHVVATTEGALADYGAGCTAARAPETVFAFTVDETRGSSTFTMDARGWGSWDTSLYLRHADCEAGEEVGCNDDGPNMSLSSTFTVPELEPGDYFLFADGFGERSGVYDLRVELGPVLVPADNEDCLTAEEVLVAPDPGAPLQTEVLHWAANDLEGSCGGADGNELVYRFLLEEPTRVGVTRAAEAGELAVYVLEAVAGEPGCEGAQEVACELLAAGEDLAVELGELAAGDYYLVVDGPNADLRGYALQLVEIEPPANDTCAAPEPLVFDEDGAALAAAPPPPAAPPHPPPPRGVMGD